MIRKVYEVDPLLCPTCGAKMRIISHIEDYKVIDKIIEHLKLTFMGERPPPPQVLQHELRMTAEEKGSISESLPTCFLLIQGLSLSQTG